MKPVMAKMGAAQGPRVLLREQPPALHPIFQRGTGGGAGE